MKNKLIFPIAVVVFAAACGGEEGVGKADQKNFEVVQEGAASGVTSTIQGPGETLPPITGTNADTTTAFSIDPNAAPGAIPADPAATLAGSLPPSSTYPASGSAPAYTPAPSNSPSPSSTPARRADPARVEPRSQPERQPSQPTEPQPQPNEPAVPAPAEPAPVPAPAPQPQPEPVPEPDSEPAEEEPPPPTTTDTRGQ